MNKITVTFKIVSVLLGQKQTNAQNFTITTASSAQL